MFANSITIEVPDFQYIIANNLPVIWGVLAIIGAAIAGSVLFEVWKRRKESKTLEKLAKRAVATGLVVFQTLTVSASYFLVIVQDNKAFVEQLPWLAVYIPAATGIARTLYDLGLNKRYQAIADLLSKWTAKKPKETPAVQANPGAGVLSTEPASKVDPLS